MTPDDRGPPAAAVEHLKREVAALRRRLEEAEETIRAIREDEVDAFVVSLGESDRVLTLESADRPYRVLVESMQQGALTLSANGTILYGNPRFAALVGRPQDEVAGLTLLDLVSEEQRPACDSLLREGRAAGAQGEALFARGDGARVPVHLAVSPLPVVGAAALCLLVTDLTERKDYERLERAEAALRESQERLRLAHQAGGLGTFEWDVASGAMVWDAGYRELFGFGPSAPACYERWRSALHPEDADRVEARARDGLGGGVTDVEFRVVRPDGEVRFVNLLSRVVGPSDGGPPRVIGICMDVTRRKRAEGELRRARDELELRVRERTAELARALQSLEHETAVRGRTEQARLGLLRRLVTVQEDERRRIARELHDALGQHLTALTLELKLLQGAIPEDSPARERLRRLQALTGQFGHDAHRLTVELRPTSLDDMGLATALANYLEEWAGRTGIAVEFHRDRLEGARAPADVELTVYRVLQETLTNVLKHAAAARVCVLLERQGRHLHLTVEDDGRGFDADAETAAPGAGGHLGLLGMQERVAMVGGSLLIESSPGSHTTVFVRVPAFEDPGDGPMVKLRVFLVDDHTVVREGLKALINTQPDMEVVGEAADGRTACRAAPGRAPDVVIIDISMPDLGGAKATELLRQALPSVKVLALTVHEETSYLRQLLQAGASGYLLKRAAADELIQAIRVVAGGGTYLDPSLADKVIGAFVKGPLPRSVAASGILSEREEEVLRLVAKGHTNKEIAARLDLSVKTVETYKTRSMEKLGLDSRAAIVSYASQQGWLSVN